MKKSLKILILGLLTIGMATGCKINKRNGDSSGSDVSSSVPADSSADSSNDASSQDPNNSSDNSVSSSGPKADSASSDASDASSGGNYDSDSRSSNPLPSSSGDGAEDSGSSDSSNPSSSNPSSNSSIPSSSDSNQQGGDSSSGGNSSSSNPSPLSVSSIDVDATNVKKEYFTGEALDLTGLVVTATYSDGSTNSVNNYDSDPAEGTVFTEAGEKTVTISFGGQSDSFSVTVSQGEKTDWTAEEAALMADNLYGEVFPYTGFAESVVTYDEEYGTLYIQGGEFDVSDLASYEVELELLDYECYNYDDEDYEYYYLEKMITTDDGPRFVDVYIGLDDGEFSLEAYDPYYYEFPTEIAADVAEYYYDSEEVVPAFEADYYQYDYWYNAIYCYTDSYTAEADYTKILNDAGWTLQEADDDGYFGAVAPDNRYMIKYGYDSDYGDLDIYFGNVNFWNSDLIDEFFEKYDSEGFDVPAFEAEGAYFSFSEGSNNEDYFELEMYEYMYATMLVYPVTSSDVAAYLTKLQNNDWSVTGSDDEYSATVAVDSKHLARIDIEYDSYYEEVEITIHFALEDVITSEFPADKIAAALGSKVTDTVPAYTGANKGFQFLSDSYGTGVIVYVDEGTETASVNAYIQILGEANYTEAGTDYFGDPLFASPNNQIIVGVYTALSGQFTITFEANLEPASFPSEDIAALLTELGVTTDANALPAVDGADDYELDERSGYFYVRSTFASSSAANSALTSYVADLKTAGFTEGGLDSDGDMNYDSPNKQFYVCPYVSSSKLILYVVPGEFVPPATGWPAADIAELLGDDVTDVLPAYDDGTTYDAFAMGEDSIRVVAYCSNPTSAYTAYCAILVEAGYEFDYTDSYGYNYYTSPNEQLEVGPWGSSSYGCLIIDVEILNGGSQGGGGEDEDVWPADEIAALFGEDVTDVLPAYTDTTYVEASEGSYCDVQVAAYIGDNYAAAVTAYKKILTDAGYNYSYTDDYGDYHYTSPNNQLDVCPWGDSDGWLVIDIDIIAGGSGEIPTGWPTDDIAGLFQEAGFTNNLPQYNGDDFIGAEAYMDEYDEIMIDVYLDEENEENWDASIAAYAALLDNAGFSFSGQNSTGDYYYMSPDGDYGLDFGWSTVGMYICVWSTAW